MKGSYFDGNVFGFIGNRLLAWLITILTFGIAAPWGVCMRKQWELEHTIVNNRRLKFTGNAAEAIGTWILFLIASYAALGGAAFLVLSLQNAGKSLQVFVLICIWILILLYIPFTKVQIMKWMAKYTVFDDRGPGGPVPPDDFVYNAPVLRDVPMTRQSSVNAPIAPFVLGALLGTAGVAVGVLVYWAGFILSAVGLILLIYADRQQT